MRRSIRLTGIKVVTKPGGKRYVYRRVGQSLHPLPNLPENHPDFLAAYAAAGAKPERKRSRHAHGSIAALIEAYLGSPDYARMAPSSRAVWRRSLDRISQERGKGMLRDLRADHLRKDIRNFTPGAASNRLKAWRSILRFAVDEGMIAADPSTGLRKPRGEVRPHRQWTADEIEGYRQHWPAGSPERVAFEVIYWTGARCVDAARLGWQMVDADGWLGYTQAKTKGPATCPVRLLPAWAQSMAADHAHFLAALPSDRLQWIVTRTGKPRSVQVLSHFISRAANLAGLADDCTAHGLRKARAAELAEAGATASQIGAWTGHRSLSEVAHYTRSADQKGILGAERKEKMGNRVKKFPKQPN
ncbi:MAG: Site-specific recombinase XerD [Rhodobacteraceae bacterium HLUCCA12]|nr:MAG: Site-specific recombinase XerD [Rhodobacteraceae bacterium HLUCCA12]